MTYARARRRAMRDLDHSIRCLNCWHLDIPEWSPFCSQFCYDVWSARMIARDSSDD